MDLNINPYFDDFNADANFLRVLFNPSKAVQARELTQAQSILQNQVSKFANHIFKNNSPILGANIKVNSEKVFMNISALDSAGNIVDVSNFLDKVITGGTSGAQATVTSIDAINNTLYLEYKGGTFDDSIGAPETITTDDPTPFDAVIQEGTLGFATFAHSEPGIIYSGGNFIIVKEQEIIVDGQGNTGNYHIGYELVEKIATSDNDSTLFDPAQGSFNFNAPGADRLNSELVIRTYPTADIAIAPATYFSQIIIEAGNIIQDQDKPQYADIMNVMARRTHDQAGNYTVREFPIRIEDDLVDATKMEVSLEAGKAYVMGFEYELQSSLTMPMNRARTPDTIHTAANINRYMDFGPYVDIAEVAGADDISSSFSVSNRDVVYLHPSVAGGGIALADKDGVPHELRISAIDRNTVGELRIYFADAADKLDLFVSAKSIKSASGAWANIETYANGLPTVGGKNSGIPIIILDDDSVSVKNITPATTNFRVIRTVQNHPTDVGGQAVLTMQENDSDFVPFAAGGLVSIVNSVTGAPIVLNAGNYVENNNAGASTLTVTGLPVSGAVDITHKVDRQNTSAEPMTKSKATIVDSNIATIAGQTSLLLSQEDIISITSVIEDPAGVATDITANIILDNGARDYYYQRGSIQGVKPNQTYTITYDYYTHLSTSPAKEMYFTADSYIDVNGYDVIPTYKSEDGLTTFNLTNCVDFRRKLSDIATGGGVDVIAPAASKFSCGYDYYVSRVDKVYLNAKGKFGIKSGIPSRIPEAPLSLADAMTLFTITIPAYTKDSTEVEIQPADNRRYTMRDIGRLESRIKNLEYYTSLNSLEKRATELDITDVNGLSKFKNGIFVDDFKSFDASDTVHELYRATINSADGSVRCPFNIDAVDLYPADDNAQALIKNIQLHENTATVKYTTGPFIEQIMASTSINVNPYAVFNWTGEISLLPESDHWIDVIKLPVQQVVVGTPIKASTFTEWGSWSTQWTGSSVSSSTAGGWKRRTTTTTTGVQSRTGITTTIEPTITTLWNEELVSREVIPYMREITIKFTANGMRPGINLTAQFDGKDVTNKCKAWGIYGDGTLGNLTTDSEGKCVGQFFVATGTYTTGAKVFKLFDTDLGESMSVATAEFATSGVTEYYQGTITTIHGSKTTRTDAFQSQGVAKSSSTTSAWYDPVAQTILVETPEKQGVYLSDMDLFFETKDASLPISAHIVEVENGIPTQSIIPFSRVEVSPSAVTTSLDGSAATNFKFSDPVYLQDNTEYAIVVMTNSINYSIFKATLGENNLADGKGIAKQPFAGVMFTSQNASTWTPDQNSDLKFSINKCSFSTGIDGVYDMTTKITTIPYSAPLNGFERGDVVTSSSGGTATVMADDGTNLIVSTVVGIFADTDTLTGNGLNQASATQNGAIVTTPTKSNYATLASFNFSALELEGTTVAYGYKFPGDVSFTAFDGTSDISLNSRKTFDTSANAALAQITLNTANANISPIVSLNRSLMISVDNNDNKYITHSPDTITDYTGLTGTFQIGETINAASGGSGVAVGDSGSTLVMQLVTGTFANTDTLTGATSGATATQIGASTLTKFEVGETVTGVTSGATGRVVSDDGTIVFLSNHNRLNFNNLERISGDYSNATATSGSSAQLLNLGTYVTKPVTLVNPSDDLRVIFDAYVPSGANLDVSFNASGYISKHAAIYSAGIGDPTWSNAASALNGLEQNVVGLEVNIYDVSVITTPVNKGKAVVTKVDGSQINLQSISNPLNFLGGMTITNDFFYTTEILPGAFTDWAAGAYLTGDYVRHNDLMWKANVGTSVEPTKNASDWTLVPGVFGQDKLIEANSVQWRPLKLEAVPSATVSGVMEYTYIPDEHILDEFTTFSIKVEMKGNDAANVPAVSNFRAIAVI